MLNRVVIGSHWGDEGKAKVVDYLTAEADVVIRFQGGANAGHTVEVGDDKFVFHLIPSGIMHPGKACVIGNGVVLDPIQILKEIAEVEAKGIVVAGRLYISDSAQVVLPYHRLYDAAKEKKAGAKAIGTTGRGIGPTYSDKVARRGVRVGQLLQPKVLEERCRELHEYYSEMLNWLGQPLQITCEEVVEEFLNYGKQLAPYLIDSAEWMHRAVQAGKKLLFEGAQGTILDLDHGTHPYVTSSNTVAAAACVGSGVGPKVIGDVVGVVKAYTTRVGNGPFPTELLDATGELLRAKGVEYGATTGRPRRCGWFDGVVLRKAASVNGLTHLAITKLDVLDEFPTVSLCTGYRIGNKIVDFFPSDVDAIENAVPVYKEFPGWQKSTVEVRKWEDLPVNAQNYLKAISELVQVPIGLVSVGPKRHQVIRVDL